MNVSKARAVIKYYNYHAINISYQQLNFSRLESVFRLPLDSYTSRPVTLTSE